MPTLSPHSAASLSETAAPRRTSVRAPAAALTVAGAVVALGAVVGGFALVAMALVGIGGVSLWWGSGLCVGGWLLSAVLYERAASRR